jgi:hypothetical protein
MPENVSGAHGDWSCRRVALSHSFQLTILGARDQTVFAENSTSRLRKQESMFGIGWTPAYAGVTPLCLRRGDPSLPTQG